MDDPRASPDIVRLHAELEALRRTRTFRWTAPLRRVYGRLRGTAPSRAHPRAVPERTEGLYAEARHVDDISACVFYHSMDLPRSGPVTGYWDLRGNVDDHLGHTDFSGRRVLEIGPASGFLTFEMERRGAEVVCVDLAPDESINHLPAWWADIPASQAYEAEFRMGVRNAFWLAHREHASAARVHYGNAHRLPDALGPFDIATVSCVLLHNRDPVGILAECARITDGRIVVADLAYEHLDGPVLELWPTSDNRVIDTWWRFSPDFFVQLLDTLGFRRARVTHYEQYYTVEEKMLPLFTVTADRA